MEVVILLLINMWTDLEKVAFFFLIRGGRPKNVCIIVIAMKTDGNRMIKNMPIHEHNVICEFVHGLHQK